MTPWTRRHFGGALSAALVAPIMTRAAGLELPVPVSLQQVALDATRLGEPLVLLVSLPGCPYCELVRRNYLLPLRAEGLHAWQISVTDSQHAVRDFFGAPSTGARMARYYEATYAPTVLFLDARGFELSRRLVGIAVPDFYGAYLDEALAAARRKLVRTI